MSRALKTIFRTVLLLGTAVFLAVSLRAFEMAGTSVAGVTYRITRDDINAGGGVMTTMVPQYVLSGSIGGPVDSVLMTDGPGGQFRLQSGLQGQYYYPDTVTDVTPMPVSQTQIQITWTAPRGEVPAQSLGAYPPASSYVIKYSSITPLDSQAAFQAASTAAQSITPAAPAGLENLSIPGLQPNTSYYVAVESLDGAATVGRNASYFSTPASTWTLANVPSALDFAGFTANSIRLTWATNNNRPGVAVTFDAQVAQDAGFSSGVNTFQVVSAAAGSASNNFTSMAQGVDYHFRVRARNGAGVPSAWSVAVSTRIPVGLPVSMPFTGIDVDRFTVNWLPNDGIARPPWNAMDPSFEVQADTDESYNTPMTRPAAQTLSATYTPATNPGRLTPNTTYYARVRAFPSGGGQPSAYADLGWTMTGVHRSNAVNASAVYVDSATFSWAAPAQSNGPNPFFYRVEMSTAADFTGAVTSSTVSSAQLSTAVQNLTPNTVYHARLVTLNGILIPSAQGPLSIGTFTTRPMPPAPGGFTVVDDYRVGFNWTHNGNNPQTIYRVEIATQPSFAVLTDGLDTPRGATSHLFNAPMQLLADATYYVRVSAVGDGGVNSLPALIGSTVTWPTAASMFRADFVSPDMITVAWNNANFPNAMNPFGGDTRYRVELRDAENEPAADRTQTTTALSQTFNGLAANTTYHFRVYTESRANWPDAGPATGTVVTLAMPPGNPSGFSNVTATGLTVSWSLGVNPASTRFRVELSTLPTFSVISRTAEGDGLVTAPFTGLLANTTYYARAWGVNHGGAVSASSLLIGSTVTLVNTPALAGIQVSSVSVTILVDTQGNSPTTDYRFRDLNAPFSNAVVQLQPADATHPWPWHAVAGLPVNSSHTIRFSAINRAGTPTPEVQVSTWTTASPDAVLVIGNNQPWYLDVDLNPGSNPTVNPATQFAIQLEMVQPDGFPTLGGRYFGSQGPMSGPRRVFMADASAPVWRTLSEWNNGVMISSGLATGRTYFFRVYARNGENGVPGVVTVCQPSVGQTRSYIPIMYLGGVDAYNSIDNAVDPGAVWHNNLTVPFIALGAFNNNIQLKNCAAPNCATPDITLLNHGIAAPAPGPYPGWNGRHDPAGPIHTAVPAPVYNYAGPLSGIRVPSEGRYKVHIVGDSYPYIPAAQDSTLGHYTDELPGPTYTVFIDTTAPSGPGMNLRALRRPGDTIALPSTGQVGWNRPWFDWVDPDTEAFDPGNTRVSPIVGYSFVFGADSSAMPLLSTDTSRNTAGDGSGEGFIPRSGAGDGWQAQPISAAGVYYFRMRALDKAGNWSPVVSYTYDVVPDLIAPTYSLAFSPSFVRVAASSTTVAVSTGGVVTITFSERMNPNQTNAGAFTVRMVRDNMNQPAAGGPVSMSSQFDNWISSATLVLSPALGYQPGGRYTLQSTPNLEDESGNVVFPPIDESFQVLMDPALPNVVAVDLSTAPASVISFPAATWNGGPAGLAVNPDPVNAPLASPNLGAIVTRANAGMSRGGRGYSRPFVVHEFNLYDAQMLRLAGNFNQAARITMRFVDDNNDGVVDETEGSPKPIRVSSLAIYLLDEKTGLWSRLPTSQVDAANRTVSANLYHFSVYALFGTPSLNLDQAKAAPVPYKPSIHTGGITFVNVGDFGTIKVYTVNGQLVKSISFDSASTGLVNWDPVTTDNGDPLASDVYIYVIENPEQKKTGKLMVVR